MSSSSNNGQQLVSSPSSKPKVYIRPWNELRHLESTWNNAGQNEVASNQHRTAIQAVQLAKQLQQLQINHDHNLPSTQITASNVSSHSSRIQNETMAEEALIERLKALVTEFVNRPDRHYSYDASMRWSIDHCDQIRYSIAISIKKPSNSI